MVTVVKPQGWNDKKADPSLDTEYYFLPSASLQRRLEAGKIAPGSDPTSLYKFFRKIGIDARFTPNRDALCVSKPALEVAFSDPSQYRADRRWNGLPLEEILNSLILSPQSKIALREVACAVPEEKQPQTDDNSATTTRWRVQFEQPKGEIVAFRPRAR